MGIKNWWKRLDLWKKILFILIFFFIFSLILLFLLIFFYPVGGQIIEDNSILEKICEIQPFCKVGIGGSWPCNVGKDDYIEPRLKKWSGFKGCNNQTKGYSEEGYVRGLKSCSCRIFE